MKAYTYYPTDTSDQALNTLHQEINARIDKARKHVNEQRITALATTLRLTEKAIKTASDNTMKVLTMNLQGTASINEVHRVAQEWRDLITEKANMEAELRKLK